MKNFYLNIVIITALALAHISPACAFVSGQTSVIEICTADGFVKTVEVAADMNPFYDADSEQNQTPPQAKKQCAFCFAGDHIIAFMPDSFTTTAANHQTQYSAFIYKHPDLQPIKTKYSPRAPPPSFS